MVDQVVGDLTPTGTAIVGDFVQISDAAKNDRKETLATVKTAISLNNVDNTSDANKPVSTATQTALDDKADDADIGVTIQAFDADTAKTDVQQAFTAEQNFVATTSLIKSANNANTSITPVLADAGTQIITTAGTAVTFTIPTNASVAYPIGTIISVFQEGAGQVTFAGAGVVINSISGNLKISAQYGEAYIQKTLTDTWKLVGSLAA